MMLRYKRHRQLAMDSKNNHDRKQTNKSKTTTTALKVPPSIPSLSARIGTRGAMAKDTTTIFTCRYPKRVSSTSDDVDIPLLKMKTSLPSHDKKHKKDSKPTKPQTGMKNEKSRQQQPTLIPPKHSPYLFPIDNSNWNENSDQKNRVSGDEADDSSMGSITTNSTLGVAVPYGNPATMLTPISLSPSLENEAVIWKNELPQDIKYNQGDRQEDKKAFSPLTTGGVFEITPQKRVSFSSTGSLGSAFSPITLADVVEDVAEEKAIARTTFNIPQGFVIKTPITSAASALLSMMTLKNDGLTLTSVTQETKWMSSKPTNPKAAPRLSLKSNTKKPEKIVHKKKIVAKHDSYNFNIKSLTMPRPAFTSNKRIPRKFTDDPTLRTVKGGMRLTMPNDRENLNSLHCFVRSELLEVFVLDEPGEGHHRVGIRCVHCGRLPKSERAGTSMSTFFPKSLQDIYRGVCTWQRIHFKNCRHMPEDFKEHYWELKDIDRTRGKKSHWVRSAYAMGFRNVDNDRSGIIYCPSLASSDVNSHPSSINSDFYEKDYEEDFDGESEDEDAEMIII